MSMIGVFNVIRPHFAIVVNEESKSESIVFSEDWKNALNGDLVKVAIAGVDRSRRSKGRISKIIKRGLDQFVGKVVKKESDNSYLLKPDSSKVYINFTLYTQEEVKVGSKVLAEFKEYKLNDERGVCTLVKVIGDADKPGVDITSLALENNISLEFPEEVKDEIADIPEEVQRKDLVDRVDLRDKIFFTVDPADAKDFDQAQGIEEEKDGSLILYTHIADVGYYVKRGSEIDKEAHKRGNSVYLPDRTVPMLPIELSNGICSLNPDVDRLATTIVMNFDRNLNQTGYKIYKSVIRSRYRMDLGQADKIISGDLDHPLRDQLLLMQKLAQRYRKERIEKSSFSFDSVEVKFDFDKEGNVVGIRDKPDGESARIVEETMLLTNSSVADFLTKNNSSGEHIYRIHSEPKRDKQDFLFNLLRFLKIDVPRRINHATLRMVFDAIKEKTSQFVANEMFLRSMEKAVYSIKNKGHFGLGFKNYIHFTAPIRRYGDLVNHRVINSILGVELTAYNKDKLKALSRHITDTEIAAMDLERQAVMIKQIEYINNKKITQGTGMITGFSQSGFFVLLDDIYASGMVKFDSMPERMSMDSSGFFASGSSTVLNLGDRVNVTIVSTNPNEGKIDLHLAADTR